MAKNIGKKTNKLFIGVILTICLVAIIIGIILITQRILKKEGTKGNISENIETESSETYTYNGEKIVLDNYTYTLKTYMSTHKPDEYKGKMWQGMAVHEDTLLRTVIGGGCALYNLKTKNPEPFATFSLGSAGDENHAGVVKFSNIYYNDNQDFPLLYVTAGDAKNAICYVENITIKDGEYISETVQTIKIDFSGFEDIGLTSYFPWVQWHVYDGYLYIVGHKTRANGSTDRRTNKHIVTKFPIPELTETNVILDVEKVVDQWIVDYDYEFMQGGTFYNGKLFSVFGGGGFPSAMVIYSLPSHSAMANISFKGTPLEKHELEACDVFDGSLLVSGTDEYINQIVFN